MTEQFIINYIPERIKQLGYRKYQVRYRDITLLPNSTVTIRAFNELWFIIDDPAPVLVESEYGFYDTTGEYLSDNSHEHKGEIILRNSVSENIRIKFIQVLIVN